MGDRSGPFAARDGFGLAVSFRNLSSLAPPSSSSPKGVRRGLMF